MSGRPPLTVLEVFQPPDGGVAEHVAVLAEQLPERGIRTVLAGPADAAIRSRLRGAGVDYQPLPILGNMLVPRRDGRTLLTLVALLRSGRFQLVHAHAQKAGVLARTAGLIAGVPSLYTPHSFVYRTQLARPRPGARVRFVVTRAVERGLGRRSAAIVAVANSERRAAIEDSICPTDRVHTILNGVECDTAAAPDEELMAFRAEGPLLGLVATLRVQKGLPTLLDALELLHAEGRSPRVAIVGNGPLSDEVAGRLRASPIGENTLLVPFHGPVEPYLAALDAFVLPSYWEGLPIAVLEAMAMGLPVVASAVGGTPEAVTEGETGYLVPPNDARALAERMASIAADPDARARMGAAGQAVAERRFGLERMVDETAALYHRAAADGPFVEDVIAPTR